MSAAAHTEEYLTTAEVARELRCSATYVSRLCREKKLRGRDLGGSVGWRIHRDDLETFIRGRAPKPTTAPQAPRKAAR